ncbi:ABC transporter permease [Stenoxybacter acetivorans]|uniref:ABC transporter permease n=1 Tax=Stenoxybacter acetivorans TaxID=422441 RepID=UPI00055FBF41|nr:ABC transporter permease [Stenoxybacter acetivorans]
MRNSLKNIWVLSLKELKSLSRDIVLLVLIAAAFSVVVYAVGTGVSTEVRNAPIAVVDEDRSALSLRIRDAIQKPYFQTPEDLSRDGLDEASGRDRYIFVVNIPPNLEADILAGRQPVIQLLADATAVTQAGVGVVYLNQIIANEIADFFRQPALENRLPLKAVTQVLYNPNGQSIWYVGTMQIVASITLLGMILVGAAVIREREHGTMEHLLVMPVSPIEIALAKILTNSAVILLAALLSLRLVAEGWMNVSLNGSLTLFAAGLMIYLFSVSALGILLATLTSSMPQFGLLCLPVYVVTRMLSGSESPLESMPDVIQSITRFSPVTQFVAFSQDVLFRNAGMAIVWPELLAMTLSGGVFLTLALIRFRGMLAKQT